MPKIKVPRSSPSLDMTPMVDLAFLLVTFFMLTTKFRAEEPVTVTSPSSHSEKILPENVMTVTIDTAGHVFYNIDGQEVRKNILAKIGELHKIKFTETDAQRFAVMTTFGLPVENLQKYIEATEAERKEIDKKMKGIPIDSLNNQLGEWVAVGWNMAARDIAQKKSDGKAFKELRFAIKGDGNADYTVIKRVVEIFQEKNVNRFSLITNLEKGEE